MTLIHLTFIDGTAFTFNAEDYMTIRSKHRIVGKLIGCSVKWSRNANLSGLPASYTPYETQLLIDKGIVRLEDKYLNNPPDEKAKQQYQVARNKQLQEFSDIYCNKKIEESRKMMGTILAGKRKKLVKMGGNPADVSEETVLTDIRKRYAFNLDNMLIQVPTQEAFATDSVEVQHMPNVDRLKYRVFCNLWESGKWLTSGESFGGDFLIYPGETLYFHASHIVHVLPEAEAAKLQIESLITRGRLSVIVNKFCVFAYENCQTNELCYKTLQWQGK